jgi:hypothetical protein
MFLKNVSVVFHRDVASEPVVFNLFIEVHMLFGWWLEAVSISKILSTGQCWIGIGNSMLSSIAINQNVSECLQSTFGRVYIRLDEAHLWLMTARGHCMTLTQHLKHLSNPWRYQESLGPYCVHFHYEMAWPMFHSRGTFLTKGGIL